MGILYIYISSNQREKHYLVLDTMNKKIEVWRDFELIDTIATKAFASSVPVTLV